MMHPPPSPLPQAPESGERLNCSAVADLWQRVAETAELNSSIFTVWCSDHLLPLLVTYHTSDFPPAVYNITVRHTHTHTPWICIKSLKSTYIERKIYIFQFRDQNPHFSVITVSWYHHSHESYHIITSFNFYIDVHWAGKSFIIMFSCNNVSLQRSVMWRIANSLKKTCIYASR